MKRILVFFMIILSLFTAGCWDQAEISDLALVVATAVDRGDKPDENVIFTIQVANPRAMLPGESGGGIEAFWTVTGKGKTIRHATYEIAHRVPRRIFFGHSRVWVVGEKAARSGITPYLDRYFRSRQSRPSLFLVVSKGMAKDVLEVKMSTFRSSGLALVNLFEQGNQHAVVPMRAIQFAYDLTFGTSGAVAPIVEVSEQTSVSIEERKAGAPKTLAVRNLAVFNTEGRMVDELNETETLGLLWIRGWAQRRDIIVSCPIEGPKEPLSLELRNSNSRTRVDIGKDGIPRFKVEIRSAFDVAEHFGDHRGLNKTWYINSLEKRVNIRMEEEMKAAISKAQSLDVDVLNFSEEVKRQHPEEWKSLKNNWQDIFPMVEVTVKSKCIVRDRELAVDTPGSEIKGH